MRQTGENVSNAYLSEDWWQFRLCALFYLIYSIIFFSTRFLLSFFLSLFLSFHHALCVRMCSLFNGEIKFILFTFTDLFRLKVSSFFYLSLLHLIFIDNLARISLGAFISSNLSPCKFNFKTNFFSTFFSWQ